MLFAIEQNAACHQKIGNYGESHHAAEEDDPYPTSESGCVFDFGVIEAATLPVWVWWEMCLLRGNFAVRHVGMTEARWGQDNTKDGENLGG